MTVKKLDPTQSYIVENRAQIGLSANEYLFTNSKSSSKSVVLITFSSRQSFIFQYSVQSRNIYLKEFYIRLLKIN